MIVQGTVSKEAAVSRALEPVAHDRKEATAWQGRCAAVSLCLCVPAFVCVHTFPSSAHGQGQWTQHACDRDHTHHPGLGY